VVLWQENTKKPLGAFSIDMFVWHIVGDEVTHSLNVKIILSFVLDIVFDWPEKESNTVNLKWNDNLIYCFLLRLEMHYLKNTSSDPKKSRISL
jgi:hypothetical protein